MSERNHRKSWTADEQWQLCEMYYNIVPMEDIALKLGRTKAACYSRMHAIKSAFNLFSNLSDEQIMELITK